MWNVVYFDLGYRVVLGLIATSGLDRLVVESTFLVSSRNQVHLLLRDGDECFVGRNDIILTILPGSRRITLVMNSNIHIADAIK